MVKLFLTNPDLLRLIRPKTYEALSDKLKPCERRTWRQVLIDAPARTVRATERRIEKATKL